MLEIFVRPKYSGRGGKFAVNLLENIREGCGLWSAEGNDVNPLGTKCAEVEVVRFLISIFSRFISSPVIRQRDPSCKPSFVQTVSQLDRIF